MINGLRIKQAREIRKLTQTELAQCIGQQQYVLSRMESALQQWPDSIIEAIALQTGFPVSFFHQGIGPEFPLGSLLFRCRATLPASEKASLSQLAAIEYEIAEKLLAKVRPIPLHLPTFTDEDPKEAARITRTTLGIAPDVPIEHLINRLERSGVFVFAVPDADKQFDSFSLWIDVEQRRPVMLVNVGRSGDRLRFNCAHELAHLVLHRSPRGKLDGLERQAHEFAAEFLMPEQAMRNEIQVPVTLTEISKLKPRWGVSIQALIKRSFDLELITDRQYRYLFEQISKNGWRKREPANLDIPTEKPRMLRKLAEMAFGNPPDVGRLAELVSIPADMARQILAAHADLREMPKREEPEDQQPTTGSLLVFKRKA